MINKQSMWFLTLLSLVLILGVYYVTMPNELLQTKVTSDEIKEDVSVNVSEVDALVAMKANRDEKTSLEIEKLESVLTDESSTAEDKSSAFEDLKVLNLNATKEEEIEAKIESEFGIKSYVEINKDNIKVVINSKEHDSALANKLMRCVQEEYKDKMYITIEFE